MHKTQFPRLLEAIDEEEHLDACDKLARGEVKTEELDARLATASPRIKAIREMSEPFNADFHQRLGDILERPPAAKAPAVDVTPIALRSRRKPPLRAVLPLGALVLAAAAAVVLVPRYLLDAGLPEFALEGAEHNAQVLGPSPSPNTGVVRAKPGGCMELTLRPRSRYKGELVAQVFLVPKGGAGSTLAWPAALYQTDSGTLRQEGTCAPLPAAAGSGEWRIVVAYGKQLPDSALLINLVSQSPQPAAAVSPQNWAMATQVLQIAN